MFDQMSNSAAARLAASARPPLAPSTGDRMKVRPITSALALATAALALSGCVSSSSGGDAAGDSSASGGTVTIGVVMAKSGFMGPIDTPALNAMLLEADALNKDGGIDGKQID